MAFSLGSLVQTAGQAVEKHRVLQRQREQDILQKALMNAQISELNNRHQKVPTVPEPFTLGPGQQRYGPDGKLIVAAPTAVKPPEGFTLGAGGKRYDANGKLIANNPAQPRQEKPALSVTERQAAQRAREALHQMRDLYAADPTAAQTPTGSAFLKGVGDVPLVGGLVRGLTGPAAQRALSPAQQAFQRAAVQLRHNVGSLSPHARLQLGFLQDINTAYVPPAGTDVTTISQNFAPEWDSLLGQMEDLLGPTGTPMPKASGKTPVSPASPQASSAAPDWRSLRPHD